MLGDFRTKSFMPWMISIILILILLTGCSEPISSEIATDSIHAAMVVTCMGDGTTDVEIKLTASNTTSHIYLVNGDRLDAVVTNQSYPLTKDENWTKAIRYITTLPTNDPGTQVIIDFNRPSYIPATGSQVILPDPAEILSPTNNTSFTLNDQITVNWGAGTLANQTTTLEFDITCQDGQITNRKVKTFDVAETGPESFSVANLMSDWTLGSNATCNTTISLIRTTTGSITPEFGNGSIIAVRSTSVTVAIQP